MFNGVQGLGTCTSIDICIVRKNENLGLDVIIFYKLVFIIYVMLAFARFGKSPSHRLAAWTFYSTRSMRCFHGIIGYKTFSTSIVTSQKLEKENVEATEIYKRSFNLKLKASFFQDIFPSTLNWYNDVKRSSVTRKEISGCTVVYCRSFKITSPLILWVCLPALKRPSNTCQFWRYLCVL